MKSLLVFLLFMFSSHSSIANEVDLIYAKDFTRIIFAGERHSNDTAREILKNSLLSFKLSGGDTLGLEMVEAHKQYLLNDFLRYNEYSYDNLANYLTRRWKYNTSSYMGLLVKARELGLELLAIDLDRRDRPEETTPLPVIPEISKVRMAREAFMAKVLCKYNFQRIVVLIGSFHTKEKFLPKKLLEECLAESKSFLISTL